MSTADNKAAEDAVRCRLSVLRALDDLDFGTEVALDMMGMRPANNPSDAEWRNADLIRNNLIMMLAEADTFVAPDDICDILKDADKEYPYSDIVMSDILTPIGLIYFNEPLINDTTRSIGQPIRAISWQLSPGNSPEIEYLDLDEKTYVITLIIYTDIKNLPALTAKKELSHLPRMYPTISIVWEVGVEGGGLFWSDPELIQAATQRAPYIKTMIAYWTIMRQRLTEVEAPAASPRTKDLVARARKRRPNLKVGIQVIRMRRRTTRTKKTFEAENPEDYFNGPSKPERDHRWWARRYYRPRIDKKTGERKCDLVRASLRGPDGKPIKHPERAYLPPNPPKPRES